MSLASGVRSSTAYVHGYALQSLDGGKRHSMHSLRSCRKNLNLYQKGELLHQQRGDRDLGDGGQSRKGRRTTLKKDVRP